MIIYKEKNPRTVEAVLWDGTNLEEVTNFTGLHENFWEWFPSGFKQYEEHVAKSGGCFKLINGNHTTKIYPGTYLIKWPTPKPMITSMSANDFEKTWEKA